MLINQSVSEEYKPTPDSFGESFYYGGFVRVYDARYSLRCVLDLL